MSRQMSAIQTFVAEKNVGKKMGGGSYSPKDQRSERVGAKANQEKNDSGQLEKAIVSAYRHCILVPPVQEPAEIIPARHKHTNKLTLYYG